MTRGQSLPTLSRVQDLLSYDQESGALTWRDARGRSPAGSNAGHMRKDGYLIIGFDGGKYLAHRIAWLLTHGEWPSQDIDHVNGVRSDNRAANLRDVDRKTNRENMRAAMPASSTGLLGVSHRKSRYIARIKSEGQETHLGRFDSPEEAHKAYIQAKRVLHKGGTL